MGSTNTGCLRVYMAAQTNCDAENFGHLRKKAGGLMFEADRKRETVLKQGHHESNRFAQGLNKIEKIYELHRQRKTYCK